MIPAVSDEHAFGFQPELGPRKVKGLATLSFVEAKADAALLGPPRVGKAHIDVVLAAFRTAHDVRARAGDVAALWSNGTGCWRSPSRALTARGSRSSRCSTARPTGRDRFEPLLHRQARCRSLECPRRASRGHPARSPLLRRAAQGGVEDRPQVAAGGVPVGEEMGDDLAPRISTREVCAGDQAW